MLPHSFTTRQGLGNCPLGSQCDTDFAACVVGQAFINATCWYQRRVAGGVRRAATRPVAYGRRIACARGDGYFCPRPFVAETWSWTKMEETDEPRSSRSRRQPKGVDHGPLPPLVRCPPRLLYHNLKDLMTADALVGFDGTALYDAAHDLKSNRAAVHELVVTHNAAHAIAFANPELQDDTELMRAALSRDGLVLRFASARLCEDRDTVLTSVRQNGLALFYAAEVLRRDHDVVLAAVEQDGNALKYAGGDLLSGEASDTLVEAAKAQLRRQRFGLSLEEWKHGPLLPKEEAPPVRPHSAARRISSAEREAERVRRTPDINSREEPQQGMPRARPDSGSSSGSAILMRPISALSPKGAASSVTSPAR